MAVGLPIVAGNTAVIFELCDDGVEARFWPSKTTAQAAATLIDMLDCEPARLKAASADSTVTSTRTSLPCKHSPRGHEAAVP